MEENIQEWFDRQRKETPDEMYYKAAAGNQIMFVRDDIAALVGIGLEYSQYKSLVKVISTHRSKSVVLPVYQLARPDLGLTLVARDNFYNWKLSVISEKPLDVDFTGLCHTTPPIDPAYTGNPLSSVYFEGFPKDLVFGYYSENKSKFSLEVWDRNAFWTAIFLIMKAVGAIKPAKWSSKK